MENTEDKLENKIDDTNAGKDVVVAEKEQVEEVNDLVVKNEEVGETIKTENTEHDGQLKIIRNKVVTFVDRNGYTALAIGTGFIVGAYLLTKYLIKRNRK